MRKLIQVSAFYKNDQPEGIGITLTDEFGDLEGAMQSVKGNWDDRWRLAVYHHSTASLVRSMFAQLDELGCRKPFRERVKVFIAVGNIYLLENVGALKADEWNGLLLAYKQVPE